MQRRSVLLGMGALAASLALPHPTIAGATSSRKPPRLNLGDIVGLIEPAGFSDGPEQVEAVKATIAAMGLVPRVGRHVASRFGYLAGTDAQRADDVNTMFADPEVKAIFAIRGGWGCARILPLLDWDVISANPKLLIGSSDITALHLAIAARAGFPTIHAPNAASSWRETSWNSLWRLAFTGETPLLENPQPEVTDASASPRLSPTTITPGLAKGRLLGGNLSVLSALIGTPWLPDFDGAILFLEDTGESEYRIDRMMSQLALSGILDRVAGVILGQYTRCSSNVPDYIGFTVPEILQQYLAPLGVPALYGANIGHIANQLAMPLSVEAELDASAATIRILEPVVA